MPKFSLILAINNQNLFGELTTNSSEIPIGRPFEGQLILHNLTQPMPTKTVHVGTFLFPDEQFEKILILDGDHRVLTQNNELITHFTGPINEQYLTDSYLASPPLVCTYKKYANGRLALFKQGIFKSGAQESGEEHCYNSSEQYIEKGKSGHYYGKFSIVQTQGQEPTNAFDDPNGILFIISSENHILISHNFTQGKMENSLYLANVQNKKLLSIFLISRHYYESTVWHAENANNGQFKLDCQHGFAEMSASILPIFKLIHQKLILLKLINEQEVAPQEVILKLPKESTKKVRLLNNVSGDLIEGNFDSLGRLTGKAVIANIQRDNVTITIEGDFVEHHFVRGKVTSQFIDGICYIFEGDIGTNKNNIPGSFTYTNTNADKVIYKGVFARKHDFIIERVKNAKTPAVLEKYKNNVLILRYEGELLDDEAHGKGTRTERGENVFGKYVRVTSGEFVHGEILKDSVIETKVSRATCDIFSSLTINQRIKDIFGIFDAFEYKEITFKDDRPKRYVKSKGPFFSRLFIKGTREEKQANSAITTFYTGDFTDEELNDLNGIKYEHPTEGRGKWQQGFKDGNPIKPKLWYQVELANNYLVKITEFYNEEAQWSLTREDACEYKYQSNQKGNLKTLKQATNQSEGLFKKIEQSLINFGVTKILVLDEAQITKTRESLLAEYEEEQKRKKEKKSLAAKKVKSQQPAESSPKPKAKPSKNKEIKPKNLAAKAHIDKTPDDSPSSTKASTSSKSCAVTNEESSNEEGSQNANNAVTPPNDKPNNASKIVASLQHSNNKYTLTIQDAPNHYTIETSEPVKAGVAFKGAITVKIYNSTNALIKTHEFKGRFIPTEDGDENLTAGFYCTQLEGEEIVIDEEERLVTTIKFSLYAEKNLHQTHLVQTIELWKKKNTAPNP